MIIFIPLFLFMTQLSGVTGDFTYFLSVWDDFLVKSVWMALVGIFSGSETTYLDLCYYGGLVFLVTDIKGDSQGTENSNLKTCDQLSIIAQHCWNIIEYKLA